jgi:ketosteroid isomerase-like protein
MYRAIDTDDLDTLGRLFRDDAVCERPAARPLVGRDAIVRFYANDRRIASGQHTIQQLVIDGAAGAAWGSFSGRRVEGWTLDLCFADGFTFADGLIATRRSHVFLAPPYGVPEVASARRRSPRASTQSHRSRRRPTDAPSS